MVDRACSLLINYDKAGTPNLNEIKTVLEKGSNEQKIAAMKKIILLMLNGERAGSLLMTVIRFVLPTKDHTLKKLLLLFWEAVEKTSSDGKLLPEMILVCNSLRIDLNHPNEYIRGSTLRFLCKLKEAELIDPLLPSIRNNLEHRHSYVRRNAVLAIYNIYKNFPNLIPDAPELIFNFLSNEGDASCKRNAFLMLFNCAQDKLVEYLSTVLDQVASFTDLLQLIVVEIIRKVCRTNPAERSKYIRCIFTLLGSSSSAVKFESAITLTSLLSAPTAIRAAASTFIDLLCNESDNNVKMIVLDRLLDIKQKHPKVLQELLMDVLRALASPNMDIRKKTLDIVLDLVSPRNIEEVIQVLKKEINKTQGKEVEKGGEYRQLLIQAIHTCAVKFPDVAGSVVHVLMDFLGDSNVASAVDVAVFVREVVETYEGLRADILRKLVESMRHIKASKVFRTVLWLLGEYSTTPEEFDAIFASVKELLGPLLAEEAAPDGSADASTSPPPTAAAKKEPVRTNAVNAVLADGTYATQSVFTVEAAAAASEQAASKAGLYNLLVSGDFFLGSVVASTLTKLVLKSQSMISPSLYHRFAAEVLLVLVAILRLGHSKVPIDQDSYERICLCIRLLTEENQQLREMFLSETRKMLTELLAEQKKQKPVDEHAQKKEVGVQADDLLKLRQLRPRKGYGLSDVDEDDDEADLSRATGALDQKEDLSHKLNRIQQLTGFSDPIYAEAYVNVHQYDIVLDVTVINQTNDTLQNVLLELATLGDLKLVERPLPLTLEPFAKKELRANIKVSSTETGIIFGTLSYDIAGQTSNDKNCVILQEIHIDIMDYISPAACTELAFRIMWAEFEWENKVAVNTNITDVHEYLQHILKCTNMKCLTPPSALEGDCGFLSANLYAKSVFGEDALANLSVEKQSSGKITGFIRIRSKTQGIALSLGDKITMKQKKAIAG